MLLKKLNKLANSVLEKSEKVANNVVQKYKEEGLDKILSDSLSKTTQVFDEGTKKTTAYIKDISETNKKIMNEIPSKSFEDNIAKVVAVVSNTTQTIINDTVDNLGKILNVKQYTTEELNSLNITDVLVFMNASVSVESDKTFNLNSTKYQITDNKWFNWNDMKGGVGAVSLMTHILSSQDLNFNQHHDYQKDAIQKLAQLFEIQNLKSTSESTSTRVEVTEEPTIEKVKKVNSQPIIKEESTVITEEKLSKIDKVVTKLKFKPELYYTEGMLAEFKVMPISLIIPFLKVSKEGKLYNVEDTELSFQVLKTKVKFSDGTETKNTLDFCQHLYQDKLAAINFLAETLNNPKYQKSLTKWIKEQNQIAQNAKQTEVVEEPSVKPKRNKKM